MRAGGAMAKVRYGVFEVDGHWSLWCGSHRLGGYTDQSAAIAAGARAACQAAGSGFDPELLIMDSGELRRANPASYGR